MKKLLILLPLFYLSTLSWLQLPDYSLIQKTREVPAEDSLPHRSGFSLGLSFVPEINSLLTENKVGFEGVFPQIGATFGLNIGFELVSSFTIRTGMYYGQKKYGHIHDGLIFPEDLSGPEPTTSRMESQVQYAVFHLPLILQFNPGGSRFFFAAGLAWDYQHRATAQQRITFGNGEEGQLPELKDPSPNFSSQISFGYAVKASNRWNVLFEPFVRLHFVDYIIVGSRLYNAGMRITLNVDL